MKIKRISENKNLSDDQRRKVTNSYLDKESKYEIGKSEFQDMIREKLDAKYER